MRGLRRLGMHVRLPDCRGSAGGFVPVWRSLHLRRDVHLPGLPGERTPVGGPGTDADTGLLAVAGSVCMTLALVLAWCLGGRGARSAMPYLIGIVLSAVVAVFARRSGFDRDRAFYPAVTIVIASYYVLFAAMSGSVRTVALESVVMAPFAAAAVAGFKSSAWIVVAALAGHGALDAVHGRVIENAGVPAWWPAWCLAYDGGAAAGLAWLLRHGPVTNDAGA